MKLGRNDPCHCGSGQKYKKCHLPTEDLAHAAEVAVKASERARASELSAEALAARTASTPEGAPAPEGSPAPELVTGAPAVSGVLRPTAPRTRPKTSGGPPPLFRRRAV